MPKELRDKNNESNFMEIQLNKCEWVSLERVRLKGERNNRNTALCL